VPLVLEAKSAASELLDAGLDPGLLSVVLGEAAAAAALEVEAKVEGEG